MRIGIPVAALTAALALAAETEAAGAEPAPPKEVRKEEAGGEKIPLFADTAFRHGFSLSFPSSARGRDVEKVFPGIDPGARPAWRLCQWATRISLAAAEPVRRCRTLRPGTDAAPSVFGGAAGVGGGRGRAAGSVTKTRRSASSSAAEVRGGPISSSRCGAARSTGDGPAGPARRGLTSSSRGMPSRS